MDFDPDYPFKNKKFFGEVIGELRDFKFKLYGKREANLTEEPSETEFDINLGPMHFTEQDFLGLSKIFKKINKKWKTELTYCVFTSDKTGREILLNVRSPKAPKGLD